MSSMLSYVPVLVTLDFIVFLVFVNMFMLSSNTNSKLVKQQYLPVDDDDNVGGEMFKFTVHVLISHIPLRRLQRINFPA